MKFGTRLFSISGWGIRKMNGVDVIQRESEIMQRGGCPAWGQSAHRKGWMTQKSLPKSPPMGTDGYFSGNNKEKRKGIVGNWPTNTSTSTHIHKCSPSKSARPHPTTPWQTQVKTLPRMWLCLKNKLEPFSVLISLCFYNRSIKNTKLWSSQKVVWRKILRAELSAGLQALCITKSRCINVLTAVGNKKLKKRLFFKSNTHYLSLATYQMILFQNLQNIINML